MSQQRAQEAQDARRGFYYHSPPPPEFGRREVAGVRSSDKSKNRAALSSASPGDGANSSWFFLIPGH